MKVYIALKWNDDFDCECICGVFMNRADADCFVNYEREKGFLVDLEEWDCVGATK